MKKDGRELDHRTLETIRLMAVQRVREGEKPSAVINSLPPRCLAWVAMGCLVCEAPRSHLIGFLGSAERGRFFVPA
jgi:hypothetical protein